MNKKDYSEYHACDNCGAEGSNNHLFEGMWFCDNCYGYSGSDQEDFDTGGNKSLFETGEEY